MNQPLYSRGYPWDPISNSIVTPQRPAAYPTIRFKKIAMVVECFQCSCGCPQFNFRYTFLAGWWFQTFFIFPIIFPIILGMEKYGKSSQLTNSIIFQRGRWPPPVGISWTNCGTIARPGAPDPAKMGSSCGVHGTLEGFNQLVLAFWTKNHDDFTSIFLVKNGI